MGEVPLILPVPKQGLYILAKPSLGRHSYIEQFNVHVVGKLQNVCLNYSF